VTFGSEAADRLATSQTKRKTQWLARKGNGWYLCNFHNEDMTEDMPGRMPEDMPVTKCINVMVGITRSKVIIVSTTFFSSNRSNNTKQASANVAILCPIDAMLEF